MSRPRTRHLELCVGLDLGARSVKAAVARSGVVTLISGFEDLVASDPYRSENDALLSWLQLFVAEHGLEGAPAVVGTPGERFHMLPLLAAGGAKLDEIQEEALASRELHERMPFGDPVYSLWETARAGLKSGERAFWVGAASRAALEERAARVRSTGLEPIAVEPDLAGLARVLEAPAERGTVLVDIGELSTQIGFLHRERLLCLRAIGLGVLGFVQPVSQELGLTPERAFHSMLVAGAEPAAPEAAALQPIVEPIRRRLLREIRHAVLGYGDRCGLPSERQIIFIGGGAGLIRPEEAAAALPGDIAPLRLHRSLADLSRAKIDVLDWSEGSTLRFAGAIGASLRDARSGPNEKLNFLPRSQPRLRDRLWSGPARRRLAAAAAIALAAFLGHRGLEGKRLEVASACTALEARLQERRRSDEISARLTSRRGQLEACRALVRAVDASNRAVAPALATAVGDALPPGLLVTRIELGAAGNPLAGAAWRPGPQGPVVVDGRARSPSEVLRYQEALRRVAGVRRALIRSLRAAPLVSPRDPRRTEFRVEVEPPAGALP